MNLFSILAAGATLAFAHEDGAYADALQRMLAETAAGRCPADVMAGPLLAACEQQKQQMSAQLASLGPIGSLQFEQGAEGTGGRVETYVIAFAGGAKLRWAIGGEQDGKFTVAYARPYASTSASASTGAPAARP
ncbi:hypothetical protein [Brevundimonas sp. Root1423]|uniref:hypothetical protein n=1 Tax=Brevundimonas sp. Root1423 TaxID=1736462 RepID=UPI0006FBCA3B|nr:hypothetical protein [Brevundimonas sp. Root1423]KQY89826.1 hypothetical protein ASD25_04665 [Brevundimonas sp. Root1423]